MSLLNDRISSAPAHRVNNSAANSRTFPTVSGRAFCRRNLLLLVVLAGAAVALLLTGADTRRPAQAAATPQNPAPTPTPGPTPDYSNVNDILNGRRHLLRTDDLAVISNKDQVKILHTTDSAVTDESGLKINTPAQCTDVCACEEVSDPSKTTALAPLTGRMFDFSADVYVTPVADPGVLEVYSPTAQSAYTHNINTTLDVVYVHAMKTADFNGDGFDDLVVNYGNSDGTNGIQIITAGNVNAFADGLYDRGENVQTIKISDDAMTVGDFDGDGRPEIIGVVPQDGGDGLRLVRHTVDEKTLLISDAVYFPLTIPEGNVPVPFISAAVGQFTSSSHDQLLIAYAANKGTAKVKLIDFVPTPFQPLEASIWDTGDQLVAGYNGDDYCWSGRLRLQVGRFDWSAQYDGALLLHGNNFHQKLGSSSYEFTLSTLAVVPVDSSIKELGKLQTGWQDGTVYDMVLGNFDRREQDPLNPQQTDRNPDLQAAVLSTDDSGSTAYATIYDIDPQTSAPKQASAYQFAVTPSERMSLASGDMQGRSMRLGEPTKVTIEGTTQPTVVAAAPPMHVAFMPAVGASQPGVLNLSVAPDGFYTTYETDETASNQSSTTHTTSWSFGAKESATAGFTLGDADLGNSLSVKDTFTAAQDLKGGTENAHGTYSTQSFDISQQTGFADQLWYTQTRFNIYVYPVIGQTICPATKPNCQDSEKVPLTIQFSGPDQISSETVAGSQIEWYQPTWEYGNVLSYPASYSQLQQIVPDISKLSNDLTWATDSSVLTEKTTWSVGTSDSQSSSFEQNYSFENDFSASATVGIGGVDVDQFGFDLDISGSYGLSNLNKSSTDLGKSTGIGIHKPGSFASPEDYGYFVTPYIFGQQKPGGSVDQIPLSGDIQTFGLLRTAFVVNPTSNNAGGWWKQAYTTHPDVALNHPNRWQVTTPGLTNPIPANCLATGTGSSQMNCAALAASYPADPWVSEFHHMRGFFISDASHPGQGPQLETATAGDKLSLQTRVYNYSLAPMAPDAKVHVRFYGMPWNNSNNTPDGDSFLIGEDVLAGGEMLGPIPPWSADPSAPLNWVLAQTTFDTTPYADKYLVFWVVVWTEKADGTLATEIADHGLTSIPGTLKSLADIQTESYSNNVGFYKSAFHVFAPSTATQQTVRQNGPADVRLGLVRVSRHRIEVGQAVEVSALLRTRANTASGVSVVFYDGDPAEGGKAFDVERIPHLRARDAHEVRVLFRPKGCGDHRVFVSVGKGKPFEATHSSLPVRVKCA